MTDSEKTSLREIKDIKIESIDDYKPFAFLPQDYEPRSLERFNEHPSRIYEAVTVHTAESFIDYIQRFKNPFTTVFSDQNKNAFQAIIDYHQYSESGVNVAEWGSHSVQYFCSLSRNWERWKEVDGVKMTQLQFAEFLEERARDIVSPPGAELLDIALKFSISRKSVFGSAIRLNSGEVQFQYSDQNEKKSSVEVPEVFTIGVAPFHNGEAYEVKARLRYRLNDGDLSIWYQLIDPENVVEDAFKGVCDTIKKVLPELNILEATLLKPYE